MIPIHALLYWGRCGLQLVARLGRYLIIFLWGLCQTKATLAARTVALQSQLASCLEQIEKKETPKPQLHPAFRLLWVVISKAVDDWQDLAHVMKPATVKRWHSDCLQGLLEVEFESRTPSHRGGDALPDSQAQSGEPSLVRRADS